MPHFDDLVLALRSRFELPGEANSYSLTPSDVERARKKFPDKVLNGYVCVSCQSTPPHTCARTIKIFCVVAKSETDQRIETPSVPCQCQVCNK